MPPAPKATLLASVPVKVSVFDIVKVLPSAIVTVAPVAGVVHVILLTVVAVAIPRTGVVKVGEVARTPLPVPVVVIASSAVPPEFTATTLLPLPDKSGSLLKPASILSSSVRREELEPKEPVVGYVVWSKYSEPAMIYLKDLRSVKWTMTPESVKDSN